MSCRCRLTPDSRSLPPAASSRFWVFSSTPRPALEMYSRPLQSERHLALNLVQERLGGRGLGCVQPARDDDDVIRAEINREHALPLFSPRSPAAGRPARVFRNVIRLCRVLR